MSRVAKTTLIASIVMTTFTIWAVHHQQNQEHQTMYQGVLRDDVRRREKMQRREEDLRASQQKHEIYARVQSVTPTQNPPS